MPGEANRAGSAVVRRVERLVAARRCGELSDAELLCRFTAERCEASFAELVRRHGPLVLATARRVTRQPQDAEDVFQAAFLTLARKAGSLRREASLAGWLYRVTWRLALRARKQTAARDGRPLAPDRPPADDPLGAVSGRELCSAVDEELNRLPEKYRAPVVLCCLEGLARDEAAARLGWSLATLKRRLTQGRNALERLLARRGLMPASALGAALLPSGAAPAEVPFALARGALAAAASPISAGAVAPRVTALSDGLLRSLRLGRLKTMAAVVVTVGLLGAVSGVALLAGPADRPAEPARPDAERKGADAAVATREVPAGPLPPGALARIGTTRFRHTDWVSLAVWSPDGKVIASAAGRAVYLWDAATGRQLDRLVPKALPPEKGVAGIGLFEGVSGLAFSPDGNHLVTTLGNAVDLWSWDAQRGKASHQRQMARASREYDRLSFDPDGRHVVTASADEVEWVDGRTGTAARSVRLGRPAQALAVSPDGKTLAAAFGEKTQTLKLLDAGTGTPRQTLLDEALVDAVAFATGGDTLAVATHEAEEGKKPAAHIRLWDVATGREGRAIATGPGPWRCLAFSTDCRLLAGGNEDDTVRVWDRQTGAELFRTRPLTNRVYRVAFRSDSKVLMSVGAENLLRFWDVRTGKELPVSDGPTWSMGALAYTPDGRQLLAASGRIGYLFDAHTGRPVRQFEGQGNTVTSVAVSGDGRRVALSGHNGVILLCDRETGAEVLRIKGLPGTTDRMDLSSDGRLIASTGGTKPNDSTVFLWDAQTGKALEPIQLPAKAPLYSVHEMRFSPDGTRLALCSGTDTHVPVYDVASRNELVRLEPHDGGVSAIAFSPDGRSLASLCYDETVSVWEVSTGKPRLAKKNIGMATGVGFSADGRYLAVANNGRHRRYQGDEAVELRRDATVVRLLDAFTGDEVHRFVGHAGGIGCLAFSPDGKTLAAGSDDTSGLVWDVATPTRGKRPILKPAEPGDLPAIWDGFAEADAKRCWTGIGRLVSAGEPAVTFLKGKLRPVPAADAVQIERLLRDLESNRFAVRDQAVRGLRVAGEAAEPLLRKSLGAGPPPETRERVERLLAELTSSGERVRAARALEVLERLPGEPSRALLVELSKGAPDAWLTREAAASLRRLDRLAGIK